MIETLMFGLAILLLALCIVTVTSFTVNAWRYFRGFDRAMIKANATLKKDISHWCEFEIMD